MWRAEPLSSSAGNTNICTTRHVLVRMLVLLANKDNSFGGEGWELESVSVQDDTRAADVVFGICGCEVCITYDSTRGFINNIFRTHISSAYGSKKLTLACEFSQMTGDDHLHMGDNATAVKEEARF